jgi:hypothetical protein
MGKKRITQLLEQLETNQREELHNAAAIFTVAQAAVNELRDRTDAPPDQANQVLPALPPAPTHLTQAELIERYGSYNGCRKAAKQRGIRFSKSPSWAQIIAAFSHHETFQQLINRYLEAHPSPHLQGITFEITVPMNSSS